MRLLLDEMWTPTIALALRKRGFDAIAINEPAHAGRYAGISDDLVFAHAQDDRRAIVTDNIADFDHQPDRTLDVSLDEAPFREYADARGKESLNFSTAVERLATKNMLHRIQHGRYLASRERGPARSPRLDAFDPLAEAVLRRLQSDYYLSWHSGLWHHGLIDQQSRRIYVAI